MTLTMHKKVTIYARIVVSSIVLVLCLFGWTAIGAEEHSQIIQLQGIRGERGPKGDPGNPGPTGDKGVRGDQGAHGDFIF